MNAQYQEMRKRKKKNKQKRKKKKTDRMKQEETARYWDAATPCDCQYRLYDDIDLEQHLYNRNDGWDLRLVSFRAVAS